MFLQYVLDFYKIIEWNVMKNELKVKKTKAELESDLADQVEVLCSHCAAFDAGKQVMAKPISAVLKLLLYGDRGKSLALLHQLGIRETRFVDTAREFPKDSTFARCELAGILIPGSSEPAQYLPMLSNVPHPLAKTPFSVWWSRPVVRDLKGRSFSRLQLVQEVRDTDGGGHLDAELNEQYADFKSGRYMGWTLKTADSAVPIQHPHLACIRQIAHEVLLTLQDAAPRAFSAGAYAFAADAAAGKKGVFMYGTEVKGAPGTFIPVISVGNMELIGEV